MDKVILFLVSIVSCGYALCDGVKPFSAPLEAGTCQGQCRMKVSMSRDVSYSDCFTSCIENAKSKYQNAVDNCRYENREVIAQNAKNAKNQGSLLAQLLNNKNVDLEKRKIAKSLACPTVYARRWYPDNSRMWIRHSIDMSDMLESGIDELDQGVFSTEKFKNVRVYDLNGGLYVLLFSYRKGWLGESIDLLGYYPLEACVADEELGLVRTTGINDYDGQSMITFNKYVKANNKTYQDKLLSKEAIEQAKQMFLNDSAIKIPE